MMNGFRWENFSFVVTSSATLFKMALCARLCLRNLLEFPGVRTIAVTPCCRKIVLQPKPFKKPEEEGHDEKNMRIGRPLSPHLTIYKFQLTANLSITHRFTGIALGGYMAALGVTSLVIDRPMIEFLTNLSTSYPTFFLLLKAGLIFPFTYHFFNGIRHLVWDNAMSLSIKGVYISGYVMLLSALVSAIALFLM